MRDTEEKTRESRLRRAAQRQGYRLAKNPRRDPLAVDFGSYVIADAATGETVADFGWEQPGRGNHLDEVEQWLLGRERP